MVCNKLAAHLNTGTTVSLKCCTIPKKLCRLYAFCLIKTFKTLKKYISNNYASYCKWIYPKWLLNCMTLVLLAPYSWVWTTGPDIWLKINKWIFSRRKGHQTTYLPLRNLLKTWAKHISGRFALLNVPSQRSILTQIHLPKCSGRQVKVSWNRRKCALQPSLNKKRKACN